MTITCRIQPTGVVTMALKVLHNICNMHMCSCDLPDMYALIPRPCSALRFWHTYQANPPYSCYNHYMYHPVWADQRGKNWKG